MIILILTLILAHSYSLSTKINETITKFMDITLVAIGVFILVAIVFLILYLFKSIKKKSFTAEDGSVFDTQSDLDLYQKLFDQTKPLFSSEDDKGASQLELGFQKPFLMKLTSEGFPDLKTLFKFRKQLKLLSDLMNT